MKKLFILIVMLNLFQHLNAQNKKLDSLWKVYNNTAQPDTNRLKAIDALASTCYSNNSDTTIILAEQERAFAEKLNQKRYVAGAYNTIGITNTAKGNYAKALEYLQKALQVYEAIGNKKGAANSYANMGVAYYNQSNYPKALESYLKALKIREAIADKRGVGACYINMGNVYYSESNLDKALEYDFKSLKVWEETGNKQNAGVCNMNIGSIYYKQSNLPKALEYFLKALKIVEELNFKQGIGNCFNNIGVLYEEKKYHAKALEYHFKSLQIRKETADKRGLGTSYGNIGGVYNSLADYKKAIQYSDSSLSMCKEIGDINQERLSYQNMATANEKTGKYKEAYEAFVKFKALTDSIFNTDNSKQLGDMKTKFEVEKKETELKAEGEVHEAKASEEKKIQTFIIYVVAGVLILVLVFSIFLYNRFTLTNKQNQIIETKSKELERLSIVARETENAILILDADGTLDWVNTSFERLNGCGLEEFKKKYGNTIYELSNNPEIRNIIQNCIATKKSVRYESSNLMDDGSIVWEASTLTPIFNTGGELTKLIIIDNDITDRKLKEEIISQKNKEVMDSIHYAKRIQTALITSERYIEKTLNRLMNNK